METTWLLAIAIIVYAILAAIIFKGMMIDVIELEKKKRQREIEGMREIGSRLDRDLDEELNREAYDSDMKGTRIDEE